MKYLWIGMGLSEAQRKMMLDKGCKLASASVSEQAIIDGLDKQGIILDSINSFHQISPNTLKVIEPDAWSRTGKSQDQSIGFTNIKYIRDIERKHKLVRMARKWARKDRDEDITVFTFQMHTPVMAAASAIKKVNHKTQIIQIVPDLPQYMDLSPSKLKKLLKKMDWLQIKHYMKFVDKYVIYAKPMADFLKLEDGSWTVMEGVYDEKLQADSAVKNNDTVSVMYSGKLDLHYGIPELLDAMKLLPENYELWLTGGGNADKLIKECALQDKRIKHFGYLPSRQDLVNKQAEATMLISTRKETEIASKYCFPSKLFEYMVSGNPVISCRLAGIPDEYFDYLIELPAVTAKDIAETVKKVAATSPEERKMIGEKQKRFILEEKNRFAQGKKILDFAK